MSDLHAGLSRYEPAILVVVALLVAAVVLPGPTIRAADQFFSAPAASPQSQPFDVDDTAPTVDVDSGTMIDSPVLATTALPDFEPAEPGKVAPAPSSSFVTPPPPSQRSSTTSGPVEMAPTHTIVASGWATANATTVGAVGVPEGGLPVGRRLSEDDKLSFVRLGASSTRLVLRLVDDAGAQRFADTATVQACRVLKSGWEAKPGMAISEAPPHDRSSCSPGVRGDDGTWTFDLSRFDDRTDQRGFALVPGPEAPADFQVTFDSVVV